MNKCLESCTGTAVIIWEREFLEQVPPHQRIYYIEANGQQLRDFYCSEICPVQRFRRRYEVRPMQERN
jgi:hypothetical protein